MSDLKLGALPAIRPYGLADLSTYAVGRLPRPPKSVELPKAKWQMFANGPDSTCTVPGAPFGDCTIAGAANALLAFNAEVDEHDPIPTSNDVAGQYLAITGGADQGCVEADVLKRWHTTGLFGANKIAGYAPVHRQSIVDIQIAISCYGAAYIGVALPASAQEQFQDGRAWEYEGDQPIGGHCVVLTAYHPGATVAVTWGGTVEVTYPWLAAYCTEVWAVIPQAFTEAGRGPAIDLPTLQADLGRL